MRTRNAQHGFTLVELMIAMVLGLLLTGALLTMLMQARQSFRQDEAAAAMQDESRYAMHELTKDISMAGFVGEVMVPGEIVMDASLDIGTDCENSDGDPFAFSFTDPITEEITTLTAVDNLVGADAIAAFGCLTASELVPGTDIIGIKRLAGTDNTDALNNNDIAIRENGTVGTLFIEPITDTTYVNDPYVERVYTPAIYFIRNFSETAGDGIPSLCRKVLVTGSTANMQTECIARGIEDLQIEYGIDDDADGTVDYYVAGPTADELETAISARVFLLSRSLERDGGYTDNSTYSISNAADYTPDDEFRRRVHMTTVSIPNVRNRILLGS